MGRRRHRATGSFGCRTSRAPRACTFIRTATPRTAAKLVVTTPGGPVDHRPEEPRCRESGGRSRQPDHDWPEDGARLLRAGRRGLCPRPADQGEQCGCDVTPAGSVATVNADETLLAGTITEGSVPAVPSCRAAAGRRSGRRRRWTASTGTRQLSRQGGDDGAAARRPATDGAVRDRREDRRDEDDPPQHDWLNHLQFSPTDPTLLMFCHEGPWHKVDRTGPSAPMAPG